MKNFGATIVIASTLLTFIACGKNGSKSSSSSDGQTTADKMSPEEEKNKDESASGGQPGFIELRGAVVADAAKGLEDGLDQHIQVKMVTGIGWRGERNKKIKDKAFSLATSLKDSEEKTLDAITTKDFVNVGCDISKLNTAGLTEKNIDGSEVKPATPQPTAAATDGAQTAATASKPDAGKTAPTTSTAGGTTAPAAKTDDSRTRSDKQDTPTTENPARDIKDAGADQVAINKQVISISADTVFVCDSSKLEANSISIQAHNLHLDTLNLTRTGASTIKIELLASDLVLDGNSVINLKGEDGTQTLQDGPSLSLAVKKVSSNGSLSVNASGSNYIKEIKNPQEKLKQDEVTGKNTKNKDSSASGPGTMQNPANN